MAALVSMNQDHIVVIARKDSKVDVAKSISTNARPILAKMRALVLMNAEDFDVFACLVSTVYCKWHFLSRVTFKTFLTSQIHFAKSKNVTYIDGYAKVFAFKFYFIAFLILICILKVHALINGKLIKNNVKIQILKNNSFCSINIIFE